MSIGRLCAETLRPAGAQICPFSGGRGIREESSPCISRVRVPTCSGLFSSPVVRYLLDRKF